MKERLASKRIPAFTVVEVLIVVAVIVLLCTILLPIRPHHTNAKMSRCINRLRQIGVAFNVFAVDHSDRFPWQCPVANNGTLELIGSESPAPHFQAVSNYLKNFEVLVCPADDARQLVTNPTQISNKNISYFVSTDAKQEGPNLILAGDRNLEVARRPVKPGSLMLTTNAILGWTPDLHNKDSRVRYGNILFTDGHVETPRMPNLARVVMRQGVATNRLVFP